MHECVHMIHLMSLPASATPYSALCGIKFTYWSFHGNDYKNAMKRPLYRGWLHACVTVWLSLTVVAIACGLLLGLVPSCWWKLMFMLVGKLASYCASANYHLHPVHTSDEEQGLLKLDLLAISIAIWAPSSCFAGSNTEWGLLFSIMVVLTIVNWVLIEGEFRFVQWCHNLRLAVLFVYFCFSIAVIGYEEGFYNPWIAATALYLVSICISPPFYRNLPSAPWHNPETNNWHEDFHLLLFAADCILVITGVQFLQDCV